MAGSRLLPLLLMALTVPPKPPGKASIFTFTGIAFSLLWEHRASSLSVGSRTPSSEPASLSTPPAAETLSQHLDSLRSETRSTTYHSPPSAEASSTDPPSPETPSTPHFTSPSSGANSIASTDHSGTHTTTLLGPSNADTSSATQLSPGSADPMTASTSPQPGLVSSPSPELSSPSQSTHPGSSSMTASWTPAHPGRGDAEVPASQRNPGVVVAICLLVSVLLIGSVVMAVRSCRRDESEFQKLDEVSLRSMGRRSSATHRPPEGP